MSLPTGRRRLPRGAALALWVVFLLLVAALVTAIGAGRDREGGALDPANPTPTGAQALARVLQQRGVHVTVVRSQRQLLDQDLGPGTTLLVAHAADLSGRTASTALRHAAGADGVVLLGPPAEVLEGMGLPLTTALGSGAAAGGVSAACSLDELDPADHISGGNRTYRPSPGADGATVCFPDGDAGYYVSLARDGERPAVSVLGAAEILANESITSDDNAALALRMLGSGERLVWYVPRFDDIEIGDPTAVRSLVPPAVPAGLLLGGSALLAFCLWRGRRLGRLVTEPLPVVVRAVETTESRGRMYRRSRDRRRALTVLQAATRHRLTAYLGLDPATDALSLAAAVAAVSGRAHQDVHVLLQTAAAHDDATLVDLANQLAALEKDVRRS